MITGNEAAKWFIFHNPELASGYIDENIKVNKLVYFSNLMYHCVHNKDMISDDFVAFPNGPVVYAIYRDYRYNGLNMFPEMVNPLEKEQEKILNIINFVYGDALADKLVEESHSHSLWKRVKSMIPNNPKIDFEDIDDALIEYNKNLYKAYSEMDFSKIAKEKINGNIYYYMKDEFDLTEDIIQRLSSFEPYGEPRFLEMISGELVVA
ncbi:MAG: DUF4065 domain-containing protein [Lachnospiraceae bacterium]|nr:DUF4065 domain-containing protein [Lachnospiraceae bacterium]